MVKVKICGITNLEDALNSVDAGCDALGFVFYPKSPRYIAPRLAAGIIKQLPKKVIKVGVFVNGQAKKIKDIAKLCRLDILQFHGDETPEFCAKFSPRKVIKAFRIKGKPDLKKISRYKVFAYLFDSFSGNKFGGTGKSFNWRFLADMDKIEQPVFLSGGLTARNIKKAIKYAQPQWVDASTSLEIRPGKKGKRKIISFIKVAKED